MFLVIWFWFFFLLFLGIGRMLFRLFQMNSVKLRFYMMNLRLHRFVLCMGNNMGLHFAHMDSFCISGTSRGPRTSTRSVVTLRVAAAETGSSSTRYRVGTRVRVEQ